MNNNGKLFITIMWYKKGCCFMKIMLSKQEMQSIENIKNTFLKTFAGLRQLGDFKKKHAKKLEFVRETFLDAEDNWGHLKNTESGLELKINEKAFIAYSSLMNDLAIKCMTYIENAVTSTIYLVGFLDISADKFEKEFVKNKYIRTDSALTECTNTELFQSFKSQHEAKFDQIWELISTRGGKFYICRSDKYFYMFKEFQDRLVYVRDLGSDEPSVETEFEFMQTHRSAVQAAIDELTVTGCKTKEDEAKLDELYRQKVKSFSELYKYSSDRVDSLLVRREIIKRD